MQINNDTKSYGIVSKLFHWIMGITIIALTGLGYYMAGTFTNENDPSFYGIHKSLGVAILLLFVLRIFWKAKSVTPQLPDTINRQKKLLAKITHYMLYVLMFLMPFSGWLLSNSAGYPAGFFGLFELPVISDKDKDISALAGNIHLIASFILVGMLILHIAAALYHHIKLKDDTLKRMLPW